MTNAFVVADDFTGAMDTGHGFAANGYDVRVAVAGPDVDRSPDATADVLAIDADTRDVDPETAATTVSTLFDRAPSDALAYKKLDSTLRGNAVAEVDAALEATGAALAVVAPAFPATDRITVDGHHLVEGVALEAAGYDATTSDLRTLFGASRHEVRALGIGTVLEGPSAVARVLSDAAGAADGDATIVVCDATHDRHLRTIADGADRLEREVLYVGSGGLATAVSVPGAPTEPTVELPASGGALGVVGSVNDRTLEQLAAVPDDLIYRLDPAAAVAAPERTGRDAATELADRLRERGRAVVTGARSRADVERAESAAAERGVDAGARVATALGTAAAATNAAASPAPAGLVLTGGTVARAVLDALSASAIDLTGRAVGAGVPVGRIADGDAAGAAVVTKAGGFGSEGSIVNCLNFVGDGDDDSRP